MLSFLYPVARPGRMRRRKKRSVLVLGVFILLFLFSQIRPLLFFTPWHLPFTVHFTKSYVLLEPGDTYALKLNGLATVSSYESSLPLVATVTSGGYVHARKCGKTVITATLRGKKGKKIRCLVHVTELNKKSLSLRAGQSAHLYLKGLRFVFGVTYQSGDNTVAKVSGTGKVTAVGKGTTTITATCKGKTFACKVTVK